VWQSQVVLFLAVAALNGFLSLDRLLSKPGFLSALPTSSPLVLLFAFTLAVLYLACVNTPYRNWVYMTVALVPLEVSSGVSRFPVLSPIDYFAGISALAFLSRVSIHGVYRTIRETMPPIAFWGFLTFFIYGCVSAYFMEGTLKQPLRWMEFCYFFLIAALAMKETDSDDIRMTLGNILAVSGLIVSAVAIAQFSFSGGRAIDAYATFGHRNGMAAFLSLCLPACAAVIPVSPLWQSVRKTATFMVLCAFVISYSRGAWLGLGAGVAFVIWKFRKVHTLGTPNIRNALLMSLILIGPLSILVIMQYPNRGIFSTSQRPRYWEAAGEVIKRHPITGLGPGNYERTIREYLSPEMKSFYDFEMLYKNKKPDFWQHLHNLYLQIMVEFGLAGFLLWCIGFFGLVYASVRSVINRSAGLKSYFLISVIAYLIHNTVDMMMVSSLDIVFAFLLAATIELRLKPK